MLLSNDSTYAYYQLDYTFMISNNSFLNGTLCATNSTPNSVEFYNTSDFSVYCESGCASLTNETFLGYTNGICVSTSSYAKWTLIKSSFQVIGNLSAQQLQITYGPQNLNFLNWFLLNHYFDNLGGFLFNLNNSMVPRSDSGLINNPPVVLFPAITTIQSQTSYLEVFNLPVMDQNEDTIQCIFDCLCFFGFST
jgi:hypothetical protein